jgi:cytidine deaminase
MNKVYELVEACSYRRRRCIEHKSNLEIKPAFYHGAFIVSHKRFENILSYGENVNHPLLPKMYHAEESAILNLPCLEKKKNLKKVDIIVVRTTKKGCLGLSKPCCHCIFLMNTLIKEKGYIIQDIYYTDENREVEQTTLNRLLQDEIHISKYYRNKKLRINDM